MSRRSVQNVNGTCLTTRCSTRTSQGKSGESSTVLHCFTNRTGPDLLQNLLYIILKFRQHQYAVSADIEGMFLQVGVPDKDQTSLRFLWREYPTQKVVVHQYTRHIFGAKDSPTCANYALQRTADDNCKEFSRAAGNVWNNFYMDDYLESFATSEEATERCQDLVTLLKRGGFKLTKFFSNFNLPPSLPPLQDQSPGIPEVCELSSHVLGLKWNQRSDTLVVSRGVNRSVTEPVTQRLVLNRVASIFDPIGLVAPYTIKARLMLKEVWRLHGQQWDEVLSEELTEEFLHWSKALPEPSTLELQRCYFSEPVESLELQVFGDSSKEVFGAVAFRARQKSDGSTQLAFVIGKGRVAPMNSLTIPNLELEAALLASRLKRHVEASLTLAIEKVYMWSDSSAVLQWLHSPEKQPVFVANRISEISDAPTGDEWAHLSSTNNPADVVTRGMSSDELKNSAWVNRPEFLRTEDWPFQPSTQRVLLKSPKLIQDPPVAQQTTMSSASKCVEPFIIWTNYSSYTKLVRTVAYMLRVNPKFRDSVRTSTIDPGEFRRAEAELLFLAQSEMFPKEQKALAKRQYVASNSIIAAFVPFVGQNGLIRAAGRLKRLSTVPYETKHPVVLDGRYPLARLYLKHVHDSNHHQGVVFLRAHIQKTFAVLKLRSTLRSISSCCVTCRKHRATPVTPLMADLLRECLGYQERPFTYTGMEYFSPFHVSVRRSTEKRWGFLFPCMTTRAVHIEIVLKMDTSSCVMGIERFAARRGHPHTIWSGNGTNFVGADKELALCFANFDPDKVARTSASKGIKWKFNPPSAPHHGGSWERLVQSCKLLFYKILGKSKAYGRSAENYVLLG